MFQKLLKRLVHSQTKAVERFEFQKPNLTKANEHEMTLVDSTFITPNTLSLQFKYNGTDHFSFEPGQYINLVLPEDSGAQERREVRSYSMWNHPTEDNGIQLIARIVSEGRATSWLKQLTVGTTVTFEGPLGSFYLRRPLHRNLYFVATGTGLVPLRSMIHDLNQRNELSNRRVALIVGFRSEEDMFFCDEFHALESQHSGFRFIPILSQPSTEWSGRQGYVTQQLESEQLPLHDMQIYLSGNGAMIGDVVELLNSQGLARQTRRVICEKFFDRPRDIS